MTTQTHLVGKKANDFMRIRYTHDIFSRQSVGGISRYFVELVRHLSVDTLDVQVLAGVHHNLHLRELDGHASLLGRYQTSHRLFRDLRMLANRREQNRQPIFKGPAIAHHTYYSFSRPLPKSRLVATVHDMIPERFPKQFGWKARLLSAAKRRTCLRADLILANSETTKADLVDHFKIAPEKVEVTYLGNSLFRYAVETQSAPCDSPYVLYVGSRGGYKNCEVLWRALSRSPRILRDFHLVCFGGGALTTSEQRLLDELDILDRVVQVGGDDRTLANYYRHASAFVYPSHYEGFGIPPLEAMAFDCPVVASTGGSIPEIVGSAAVAFDPRDEDMLRDALESVLFNESIRERLLAEMPAHESRFRWEETARKTLAAYEKVAA